MISVVDIFIIFKGDKNSTKTIMQLDQFFNDNGIKIKEGDLYYLNEHEGVEFDAEVIENSRDTLMKLANWPTAGWIEYHLKGCSLMVCYESSGDFILNGIHISAYEPEYKYQHEVLDQLIRNLYNLLDARRIIKGVDIEVITE